jgi:hypothetical protein
VRVVAWHILKVAALVAVPGNEARHLDVGMNAAAGNLRADLFEQGFAVVGLEATETVPDTVAEVHVHSCGPGGSCDP